MKPIFLTFNLTILFNIALVAQDPVAIPDKEGKWSYGYLDDANTKMYCDQFGMNPDQIAVFRKKLDRIVEILHQNPILASPKGIDPAADSRPLYPHGFDKHPENYGYIGQINIRMATWYNSKGRIYRQDIEPPRFSLFVNNIILLKYSAFNVGGIDDPEIKKAEARVLDICKPMKIKELAPGVTLYDASIVVHKPEKSLFLPLTVAEAYKRLIAYYEIVSQKEPAFRVMLDGIMQEYTVLTPEKLAAPAYFGGMFSGITAEKNNDPLFLYNSDFFDRNLPKTAVQLIVFPVNSDYYRKESDFVPNDVGFLRIYQLQHSLDVNAFSELID